MFVGYFARLFQEKSKAEDKKKMQTVDEFGDPIEDSIFTPEEREIAVKFNEAANILPKIVSNIDEKTVLQIYAFYKQATCGPATYANRPSMLDLRNRTKFDAWASLGQMDKFDAMREYIDKISNYSSILENSQEKSGQGFGMRPSTMYQNNEDIEADFPNREWFIAAKNGEIQKMETQLELRPELLEEKDFENGMTALLWAADSGNSDAVRFLLSKGADIKSVDNEASTCEHESVVEILMKRLEEMAYLE